MSLFERLAPRHVERVHSPEPPPPPTPRRGTATEDVRPVSLIERSQPRLDPEHVTRLVANADKIPAKTRSGGNKDGFIHLSSLIGMCEREQTISHQHGVATHRGASGPMKIIWAIGRAVEKHIRNSVIVARDWQGVHGRWECRCRASSHLGVHPAERSCLVCGGGLNTYREPLLIDHAAGVIGSPDLTLIEMGWYLATEIKSMNKDQFDKIEKPLADHILQAMGYRHLYRLMGYPVLDIVAVVYGRKDFKFGGTRAVYKEYHVRAADWQGQIDDMFAAATRVRRANLARDLLPRTCTSADCTRAKSCERATMCFSL